MRNTRGKSQMKQINLNEEYALSADEYLSKLHDDVREVVKELRK